MSINWCQLPVNGPLCLDRLGRAAGSCCILRLEFAAGPSGFGRTPLPAGEQKWTSFVDKEKPSLTRLLDHVDHIRAVAGVDAIGLGSDFDGGGTLLADATEVPRITAGLLERGYAEGEMRQILGGNTLRVLRAAIG